MADPYSILGVSKGADEKAIKSAYRKLAKELHPDRNQDNPKAAERFAEITHAYDLLSDPQKRGQFDRGEIDENGQPRSPFGAGFGGGSPFSGGARPGQGGFEFGGGIDLGDIFDGLFGGGAGARPGGPRPQPGPPPKGANIAYEHLVAFTDAAKLEPQRITLRDGKTVEFKLPAGAVSGQQIRIPGKGQPGPGGNGDAMVTLKIGKHPFYERDGDNIRLELPISLKEAIKGAKVKVPTIDGAVMLSVPAGAQSGTTMRIKGRGFAKKGGERGDQLVTLHIRLPADTAALAALAEALPDDPNIRSDLGL
ncbi:MAG TPA: DnaJ C-terminal domain-containing protein [Sphingorhabdus sp.]|jgi:DnaJ-class molecular chaperone|uniref:DnaJ C-terminal domain-containing protein n=1 Tax=Sphingorhabdus sp. TaxID=1902408 RepID=UPI002C52449C|nr:DnaJ C-terminal domain-containing protein [Sphingorhabdus sp.]HMT41441.1 DnaJ C-terminal domain-containing protein [Sphingorhabdus sp.]HMU21605.1 DnaJ C-terminal domain-containing protein [Sphingorhabdus sp.]